MAQVDVGQQKIGWKFSTPLQADYLNTFLAGVTTPGLLTRPKFSLVRTSTGVDVTIFPFSLLIVPTDRKSTEEDENGRYPVQRLVKITTTTNVTLSASYSTVAIGFTYSFTNNSFTQTQWFGEFVFLNGEQIRTFDGLIIATVQCYENLTSTGMERFYSVSTSGADISDALLREEGWNPDCWLSLVHPARTLNGRYTMLEVRKHNERYIGYISGHDGFKRLSNLTYSFDGSILPEINSGDRGFMPHNFNLFNLQSTGFSLCDGADELPISKVHGGIFAMVDASAVNMEPQGTGNNYNSFANKLKIYPVKQEDVNIYYENDTFIVK